MLLGPWVVLFDVSVHLVVVEAVKFWHVADTNNLAFELEYRSGGYDRWLTKLLIDQIMMNSSLS